MTQYTGQAVCDGIAIGRMQYFHPEHLPTSKNINCDIDTEIKRYEYAKEKAVCELNTIYEKATLSIGKNNADIFLAHIMLLNDQEFTDSILNFIRAEKSNAEYAISETGKNFAAMFSNMDNEYLSQRAADFIDISDRMVRILIGSDISMPISGKPFILVAEELTPSEMVQLDKNVLLAIVTHTGSANSHMAILSKSMNIPTIIRVDIDSSWDGKDAIIDGYTGKIYIDPDEAIQNEYFNKQQIQANNKSQLLQLKGKENMTQSGKKIELFANIGHPDDLEKALQNDAGGIGLFRSEFLYLSHDDFPTEEEQFLAYKKILETMRDKKVIIRTFDIGADKQPDYFRLDKENNPALGYRAIRIGLKRPELLKTQLRALFRASVYGNLSIMYPMIISLEEVLKIKDLSNSIKEELIKEGIPVGNVEEGIMIETPAAALISEDLAKHVDFFSIGTNDLTQFTLAIDRENHKLADLYNPHHPAILKLIQMVCDNAHKAGIWAGICGELGADCSLVSTFISMGIDELSVAPDSILSVRKAIRDCK